MSVISISDWVSKKFNKGTYQTGMQLLFPESCPELCSGYLEGLREEGDMPYDYPVLHQINARRRRYGIPLLDELGECHDRSKCEAVVFNYLREGRRKDLYREAMDDLLATVQALYSCPGMEDEDNPHKLAYIGVLALPDKKLSPMAVDSYRMFWCYHMIGWNVNWRDVMRNLQFGYPGRRAIVYKYQMAEASTWLLVRLSRDAYKMKMSEGGELRGER